MGGKKNISRKRWGNGGGGRGEGRGWESYVGCKIVIGVGQASYDLNSKLIELNGGPRERAYTYKTHVSGTLSYRKARRVQKKSLYCS